MLRVRPLPRPALFLTGIALSAALAGLSVAQTAEPSVAALPDAGTAQVLVITGSDPYLPAFVAIDAAMREAVARQSKRRVLWLYEPIDTLRFGPTPGPQLAELLARKYEGIRIDAVVTLTEGPAAFYLLHGRPLWPTVPAVMNWVSQEFAQRLPAGVEAAVIPGEFDYEGTLKIAFALQPQARRVLVIGGVSPFDQQQFALARAALDRLARSVEVEAIVGEDPQTVSERLAREAESTIVLYLGVLVDARGQTHVPRSYLQEISARSRAPIYGTADTYVGSGIIAGSIESFSVRGAAGSAALLAVLDGTSEARPWRLAPPPPQCAADARQLARYRISQRLLPKDCELRYVEPTFLRRYWWQTLLVALALGAQSGLIAALLLQRRRRRAAELGYAAQRVQLLHASRLAVAGELTASIAHEINQPLGAILSNADAAEMLVQSGRLERAELLQILADIKRDDLRASEVIKRLRALLARHDTERRRFDLNAAVADSVAILGAEARRRGVAVDTSLAARAAEVTGDPVQVQQVLINLILNAFDASAAQTAGERRVRVSTADSADGVALRVRDHGQGIAADDLPRLFDSFFTTKSAGMGLGLSIARSIVEAHGGTITAHRHADGAEFCVTLPTAAADPDPQLHPEPT